MGYTTLNNYPQATSTQQLTVGAIKGENTLVAGELAGKDYAQLVENYEVNERGEIVKTLGDLELIDLENGTTDDQSNTTSDSDENFGRAAVNTEKLAQSFVPAYPLFNGVTVRRGTTIGTYVGTITISIQGDNSGEPDGIKIGSADITAATWNGLTVDVDYLVTFYAATVVGTTYWIVFESSTQDSSNYVKLRTDSGGGYASGTLLQEKGSGWITVGGPDAYFKTHVADITGAPSLYAPYTGNYQIWAVDDACGYYNISTGAIKVLKDNFTTSDPFEGTKYGDFFFLCNGGDALGRIQPLLGNEEVTSAEFDASTGWTLSGSPLPTISGGILSFTSTSSSFAEQTLSLTIGDTYVLEYELSSYSAGTTIVDNISSPSIILGTTENEERTFKFIATGNSLKIRAAGGSKGLKYFRIKSVLDDFEYETVNDSISGLDGPKCKKLLAFESRLFAGNISTDEAKIQWAEEDTGINWIPFTNWSTATSPPETDDPSSLSFRNLGEVTSLASLGQQVVGFYTNGKVGFRIRTDSIGTTSALIIQNTIIDFQRQDFGGERGALLTPNGLFYNNEGGSWQLFSGGDTSQPFSENETNLTKLVYPDSFLNNLDFTDGDITFDNISNKTYISCRGPVETVDQSAATDDTELPFGMATLTEKLAQQFTPTASSISGITFRGKVTGSDYRNNVIISIQADSASEPDGTTIASYTFIDGNFEDLSGTTDQFIPLEASLTVGNDYWIVWETNILSDGPNPDIKVDTTTGYSGLFKSYDAGSWSTISSTDAYFKTHYTETSSTNNFMFIYNNNLKAFSRRTISNISRFFVDSGIFYGASSTDPKLYKLFTTNTDVAGAAITAEYNQEISVGSLNQLNDLVNLIAKGLFSAGGVITISFDIYNEDGIIEVNKRSVTVTNPTGTNVAQKLFKRVRISEWSRLVLKIKSVDSVSHKFTFVGLDTQSRGQDTYTKQLT